MISLYSDATFLNAIKALTMAIFLSMAVLLFNTLDNIATPVSVNANGIAPPRYFLRGITFCDTTDFISSSVNSNIKSSGKRSIFLRTACFNALVSTLSVCRNGLFRDSAIYVADKSGYTYRMDWDKNVTGYILHVQRLPKDAEKIYGDF